MKLLIGADPELFVQKDNKFISGHFFQCGTKEKPMPVANGHVQNDGMALEFNVRPSETKTEFINNTLAVLGDLNDFLKSKDPEARLRAQPCVEFGKEYLASVPPEASELGCSPDYNAYTGEMNPTPNAEIPFRTGSGHIHVGWTEGADPYDKAHMEDCCILAKELDYYLGLPSLIWDPDNRRRQLYGKAGAFRPKPYGLEYRVLSNAWLKDKELMSFVYTRTKTATMNCFNSKRKLLQDRFPGIALHIINDVGILADHNRQSWPRDYQAIKAAVMNDRRQIDA